MLAYAQTQSTKLKSPIMAKGKRRQAILAAKRIAKENAMKNPGNKSRYAKKRDFLKKSGGFGFQYLDKPWK